MVDIKKLMAMGVLGKKNINYLLFDSFNRSNGAIGSTETQTLSSESAFSLPWTGATWTVATNKAVNTPTIEPTELVTNGNFSAWTGDNPDGWTVAGESGTDPEVSEVGTGEGHGGEGTGFCNLYRTSAGVLSISQTPYEIGKWYSVSLTVNKKTAGNMGLDQNTTGGLTRVNPGVGTSMITGLSLSTTLRAYIGAAADITLDDISVKKLTLASLFSNVLTGRIAGVYSVNATITAFTQAGLALCLNSPTNPTAGIIIVQNAQNVLTVYKFTSETAWTAIATSATAFYSAGRQIRADIRLDAGHLYLKAYYNGELIGTEQDITDAEIINNTYHGLFSTYALNTFDNYKYDGRNKTFINIFGFGDSKTLGTGDELALGGYLAESRMGATFLEWPSRIGVSGQTVALAKNTIDADLLKKSVAPNYILCNLGVNEAASLPLEADWKTNYLYILDAMNTKWPTAKIYIMRPWIRGQDANCATLATWIGDIVTSRSTFCNLGPDEAVFLKGADNGATYTADGTHPNATGYVLTATQWKTTLGL